MSKQKLDKLFKHWVEKYIEIVKIQKGVTGTTKEFDYYYPKFNKLITIALGLEDIKKDNLFNPLQKIEILQELIIKEIDKHISLETEYHKAFEQIKQSVQERANAIK
jgi:hypothetical protein